MLAQYCFDALAQAWPNDAMPWAMHSVHITRNVIRICICYIVFFMLYAITHSAYVLTIWHMFNVMANKIIFTIYGKS